jgi:hypothetical protein
MMGFLLEGGVGAFFVLFFSVVAVAAGALFVRSPDEAKLPALKAVVNVVWISGVLSAVTGVRATLQAVVGHNGDALMLQAGISEALAGLVLALAATSVVWMEIAIGLRRAKRS